MTLMNVNVTGSVIEHSPAKDPERFDADERRHLLENISDDLPTIEADAGLIARYKTALYVTEQAVGGSRQRQATVMPFAPDSLLGSFFRAPDPDDTEAEAAWLDGEPCLVVKGQVVAQPFITSQTTYYLVEFFGQEGRPTGRQQLVEIDQMLHQRWAFYDTIGWLEASQAEPVGEEEEVAAK